MIYLRSSRRLAPMNATALETCRYPLFIIIMASYMRKNGRSPHYIKKSVRSILSQSYSNWELFVTGDKYENEQEFRSLFTSIPSSKLFLHNLPEPGERGNLTGTQLWQSGGVVAMNNALQRAEQHHNNCEPNCKIYVVSLDDDDIWSTEHLNELLSIFIRFPSVVFAWTKGYHCSSSGNPYPPIIVLQDRVNNWSGPFGGNILHSSCAWKMEVFRGFRYRGQWDFPPNYHGQKTGDYDLFEAIRAHIVAKSLDYYHSNRATIEHLIEMGNSCTKNGSLWYPD
ncbi:unnamed protein product [Rotaria sp. Silwood2]|nr:unnamed protein product [Rotaria sp. Silwood2]CAF3081798.1 unnamed protein product [Rotaria sp. Silwood2]CAF3375917.1 unnamed protein product [Rotaria sp. Silwood2]CAF4331856.1 unnamed protein product [Rotaria sp. Silwood2]CAF4385670.1 unnamed protein product [Rotaria sp. Silwood2]